ncbi:MAG: YlxR family protein [Actinomycetota bacterium]
MAGAHEPLRTCVGCRSIGPTAGMLRVVRTADGEVVVDATRRAPGRGAWVHPHASCVEAALARGGLAKALRAGVDPETAGRLTELSTEKQERA